jgi:hypothetical protein
MTTATHTHTHNRLLLQFFARFLTRVVARLTNPVKRRRGLVFSRARHAKLRVPKSKPTEWLRTQVTRLVTRAHRADALKRVEHGSGNGNGTGNQYRLYRSLTLSLSPPLTLPLSPPPRPALLTATQM